MPSSEDAMLVELAEQLGHAAATNALELVEEADLLDENGHAARAFALTVLAAEELGKAFICTMTTSHAKEPSNWQAFNMMVRGPKKHETKLLSALYLIQKVPEVAGEPALKLAQSLSDLTAGDLDAAKMRALYVDVEGGEIATPGLVADHGGAQERARALRHEIVAWAVVLASEAVEKE